MIQVLKFLIFMSSFMINCSQNPNTQTKELAQPKPLIIVSDDNTFFRNSTDFASLSKNSINSEAVSNLDEKEKSSRLSLSAVGTCLLIAQRRHSKWSSSNSNKRKSVKSNNDDSDTGSSPNNSGKGPRVLKETLIKKPSTFLSGKTASSSGQTESFYSDTDDDRMDYQKECSESLEMAQQELLASLKQKENKDTAEKREKLKESLDTFSFPKDEK